MEKYDIVSIPSPNEVLIAATHLSDTVFVYGEEVNDFRTVDYEGLTTLNISATQELSKLVREQQAEIKTLQEAVQEMRASPDEIKAPLPTRATDENTVKLVKN